MEEENHLLWNSNRSPGSVPDTYTIPVTLRVPIPQRKKHLMTYPRLEVGFTVFSGSSQNCYSVHHTIMTPYCVFYLVPRETNKNVELLCRLVWTFFTEIESKKIGKRWLTQGSCLLWIRGEHGADNDLFAKLGSWGPKAIHRLSCPPQPVSLVSVSFTGSLLMGSYLAFTEPWRSMGETMFQYNRSICDTMYFICAFIDFSDWYRHPTMQKIKNFCVTKNSTLISHGGL